MSTIIDDRDTYIERVITTYIEKNDIKLTDLIDSKGKARAIRAEIVTEINEQITLANQLRSKEDRMPLLKNLPGYAVAMILIATGDVKKLTNDSGGKIIAKRYYKNASTLDEYKWAGTYEIISEISDDNSVMKALSLLVPDASRHDEHSLIRYLACHTPAAHMNLNNKLIFFRNGVWDYKTKTLTAYDADDYEDKYADVVSLSKLPVFHPYGAGATLTPDASGFIEEPEIMNPDGTTWTPSSCFTAPFSEDEIGNACSTVIWQLAHFTLRHMNGAPHLYHFWIDEGGKGHNGKSTLWELIQRLIKKDHEAGDDDLISSGDSVISCNVESLDKDYVLAQNILTAYAIVGEETNASTTYIENCATVKMLSREQECTFRQIREAPFAFRFSGALVQQCNKPPIFSEKSDSMFSHSVNIPFIKAFTDDRSYIKDDYIKREEVAEWLAYHLTVEMDALDKYDPEALKTLEPFKREMISAGMSTMQALDEIVPGLRMNFMPSELLYDLYLRWCDINGVTGKAVVSAKTFKNDLEQYGLNNTNEVEFTKKAARSSMKDLEQIHPALCEFSCSNRMSLTSYAQTNGNSINTGRLSHEKFTDETGKRGRLWTKCGLRRLVKWQDMPAVADIVAEIDEDAETE